MTRTSAPELLVLHAVRRLGFADVPAITATAGTAPEQTARLLSEAQQQGLLRHTGFVGLEGWSLTDRGRIENERQLALEREEADPEGTIRAAHRAFLPLNARLLRAVSAWQTIGTGEDPLAPNDHGDAVRDARTLDDLARIGAELRPVNARLSGVLTRFTGYDLRYLAALGKARSGDPRWVDGSDVDSCHRVWFQLHEDLVATLGIDRRTEQG
ncbi:transcriptional regulator [Brachybacterium hainanense]|uniref:Transcriptional regulator n=1 Tax=Brachybacterium hainanense TaxID=1541174 RepID=A0ABV6RAB2_9MICO